MRIIGNGRGIYSASQYERYLESPRLQRWGDRTTRPCTSFSQRKSKTTFSPTPRPMRRATDQISVASYAARRQWFRAMVGDSKKRSTAEFKAQRFNRTSIRINGYRRTGAVQWCEGTDFSNCVNWIESRYEKRNRHFHSGSR